MKGVLILYRYRQELCGGTKGMTEIDAYQTTPIFGITAQHHL